MADRTDDDRAIRTLVVDDDPAIQTLLAAILRERGHDARAATDSTTALADFATFQPDIVLIEWSMPGLDGPTLSRRLREQGRNGPLVLVAMSARCSDEALSEALEAGVDDCIAKPFNVDILRLRLAIAEQRFKQLAAAMRSDAALRISQERYALAARGSNDGIWDWDIESGRVFLSGRARAILGEVDEASNESIAQWQDRLHRSDRAEFDEAVRLHLNGETPHFEQDVRMYRSDGGCAWVNIRGRGVVNSEQHMVRMAGSMTDVASRKILDPQTNLPSRALMLNRMEMSLARQASGGLPFGFLAVNIDDFNAIIHSLSRRNVDELLEKLGKRLAIITESPDLVAYLGGEQFGIVVDRVHSGGELVRRSQAVQKAISSPIDIGEQTLCLSACVGVLLSAVRHRDSRALLRDADLALAQARQQGPSHCELFDPIVAQHAHRTLGSERGQRNATTNDQVAMAYQPSSERRTGQGH